MKIFLVQTLAVVLLASHALADDWYDVRSVNTLITASRGDLEAFMDLNARHQKNAVRMLYNTLKNSDELFNIQPGTLVRVVDYYDDGIARIEWGDGAYSGYITWPI